MSGGHGDQPIPVPGRIEDGFTPEKRRRFLEALAATGVVADACAHVRISRVTVYNLRNSARGRAFALAWDAAKLIARGRVDDEVLSRSMCGVIERVYRNGQLVAERHRYDNRLTMAVLTRLDRFAEGLGEGAATARVIAGEWDQFLDIVEAGGEQAEGFLRARAEQPLPPPRGRDSRCTASAGRGSGTASSAARPLHQPSAGPPPRSGEDLELERAATRLARLSSYEQHGAGLPEEIDTSALDPAAMAEWTDAQWARAEASGLLDRLAPEDWPEAARAEPCEHPGEQGDGICKACKAFRDRHPPEPEPQDDFEGLSIWEEDGEWHTDFPPPPGFDGWEDNAPGDEDYSRELTAEELAALAPDLAEIAAEHEAQAAADRAARDRFFGFTPAASEEAPRRLVPAGTSRPSAWRSPETEG